MSNVPQSPERYLCYPKIGGTEFLWLTVKPSPGEGSCTPTTSVSERQATVTSRLKKSLLFFLKSRHFTVESHNNCCPTVSRFSRDRHKIYHDYLLLRYALLCFSLSYIYIISKILVFFKLRFLFYITFFCNSI